MAQWEEPRGQRRVPLWVAVVASAALLVGGVILAGVGSRSDDVGVPDDDPSIAVTGDEDPPEPEEEREPSPLDDGRGPGSPVTGAWRPTADAPIHGRWGAVAVWTGEEVLVWGGWAGRIGGDDDALVDGAAYDPSDDAWRRIADAPRHASDWEPHAVWTGDEMVVLGTDPPMAYDPEGDRWRDLAAPPEGRWLWRSAGWAGSEVVVLSPFSGGPRSLIAYDPAEDQWRDLPDPPLDWWDAGTSGWLDSGLVVVGGRDGSSSPDRSLVRFDAASERWSEPDAAPLPREWAPAVAVDATRDRVLAAGRPGETGNEEVWEWTPEGGWREVPELPPAPVQASADLVSTPAGLLVWHGSPSRASLVRPDDTWVRVGDGPTAVELADVAVWTGNEVFVWGGGRGFARNPEGAALTLAGPRAALPAPEGVEELPGRWRVVADPGLHRHGSSLAWTGDGLVAWGGSDGQLGRDGAVYDPDADEWEALSPAPISGRVSQHDAWTGEELLVWGGTDVGGTPVNGAALDPGDGTWRAIPDAPIAVRGSTVSAWTGEELVVLGDSGTARAAAAYDPVADEWRGLPPPPAHSEPLGAVWTGDEVLVLSAEAVLRYRPAADSWSTSSVPPEGLALDHADVAWTGREALVWGSGGRDAAVGWAYEPAGDAWRELPESWLRRPLPVGGSTWTGQLWVVGGEGEEGLLGFAAYDPVEERWLALPAPRLEVAVGTGPLAWTGTEVVVWSPDGPPTAFRLDP